ncbi:MAG: 50S ribosomal protein L22 [Chlamydiia bacterium]
MEFGKAVTKYVRISPRKARLAADLIRGLPLEEARAQLMFSSLRGGRLIGKTLESAVANVLQNQDVRREELMVLEVRVDEGPRLKRSKARSKGSAVPVIKRTSHFTVVVGSMEV